MKGIFLIDTKRNVFKTYEEFFQDLSNIDELETIIYERTPYLIFLKLTRSLIEGLQVDLLDYDISYDEMKRLGISEKDLKAKVRLSNIKINNFDEFLSKIKYGSKTWKLGLYTSGTTGRPKKVYHTFENLTRNVKTGDRFKENIWAFAYNPTHIAGVQVFFQALLNGNPIIYIFDLNIKKIPQLMIKYRITNISATPTFYRNIISVIDKSINSVKRVTFGGEKFDPTLENKLKTIFPNAKIVNIYASTEAGSLLSSRGEFFEIPKDKETLFKIAEDGELLIHESLLGESESIKIENGWYHTGDIVELIEKNKIKIVGRKTEMINVGGYKVNPHEVEEEIKKIPGVVDAYVYSKKNRMTGNIIVADVIVDSIVQNLNEFEKLIYDKLRKNLQAWKIPRIINFVDKIQLTRTGKKVRT